MTIGAVLASRGNIGSGLAVGRGGAAANVLASVPWVAQWKFNNNGQDSIGANHLTAVNSPTFTTGKLGGGDGATQLVAASSQYWSIADNAALSMGDVDFTHALWIYADDLPASDRVLLSKGTWAVAVEYNFYWSSASKKLVFSVANGGAVAGINSNSFGALSANTWYCVIGWHDSVNDVIGIGINDIFDTTVWASGSYNSSHPLQIGREDLTGDYWNGRIDNYCIAKSAPGGGGGVLTAAQRTAFYAAGVGTEQIT